MKDSHMNDKPRFRCFFVIWSGELLSAVGSGLTAFALTAYAFLRTGRASECAFILLVSFLPSFLLSPVTGVLADRLNRRRLMAAGNAGASLGAALIMIMLKLFPGTLPAIYPGLIIISVGSALVKPAWKASVSDFLLPNLYGRASGLLQLAGAAPLLISPFLAGILMSLTDIKVILLADALTFLVSALIVLSVSRKREDNVTADRSYGSFKAELKEGFTAVSRNRGVLLLVILISMILFFVGLLQTLLAPLVLSFSDTAKLGMVQSVCALGVLSGSLFIGTLKKDLPYVRVLTVSLILLGLFFTFIGMKETLVMILIPGFLFFLTLPFVNTSADVLIRRNIRNEEQGRAWGLIAFVTNAGAVTAYATGGFLSDLLGRVLGTGTGRGTAFLFFLSGLSVMVLSYVFTRFTEIRDLEIKTINKEVSV